MPLTKKKISKNKKNPFHKPWITPGMIESSDKKNQLFEKARNSKNEEDYIGYKKYLNIFTRLKNKWREGYYLERAILYSQDKFKTWQLINEISNRKRKKQTSIKTIKNKEGMKFARTNGQQL